MHVSSPVFHTGLFHTGQRDVALSPDNKKTVNNQQDFKPQIEPSFDELSQSNRALLIHDAFPQKQSVALVIKEKQSYFSQQALNEYEDLQSLEKKQFAQNVLGFSLYA